MAIYSADNDYSFSAPSLPSLKLTLHDSFLFTVELHNKMEFVPHLPCRVTNSGKRMMLSSLTICLVLCLSLYYQECLKT